MPRSFLQELQRRAWRFLLALLFLVPAVVHAQQVVVPAELPAVIDAIRVQGTWRTKAWVIPRELPWKPGQIVTLEEWLLGVQRLWNMGLFSRVDARLEKEGNKLVAVFVVEERWTIIPQIQFSYGGGIFELEAGLYDINVLGRFLELGGFYQRFSHFNGGEVWAHDPRLFGQRLDGRLTFAYTVRPRPTFSLARALAQLDLIKEHRDDLRYGGSLALMADHFLPPTSGPEMAPAPSGTIELTGSYSPGLVSTVRIREAGWSFEVRPSFAVTTVSNPGPVFGAIWAQWLWFKMLEERWNLCWRAQAGAMSPAQTQQQYFLGGLDLIRGFPDNYLQTRFYVLTNFEPRFIVFDKSLLAVQLAAFFDGAVARVENTASVRAVASIGTGIRFLVPRLVHAGLRVDVAWPVAPLLAPGLSIGVYQFF